MKRFAPAFFSRHDNEWGRSINFDGPDSAAVREFYAANAAYWIAEYRMDGLRLDATQSIIDTSSEHILAVISRQARRAAGDRPIVLVAENEPQNATLARPIEEGGYGLDALWNDDFHHAAMVALTGRREAYYTDYRGAPQEFISCARHGFLFQGQRYAWQRKRRGTPSLDLRAPAFVVFIQNHDQIANSARGERLHQLTSPGRFRAMTALTLLAPGTPMLFQGQEFCASAPFLFFADHPDPLGADVRKGRMEFLAQFPSLAGGDIQTALTDPTALSTFERCRLDLGERDQNRPAYQLHCDLLALRRNDAVLNGAARTAVDGAVLGERLFLLRYFGRNGDDRLLVFNLGPEARVEALSEPLLAPIACTTWKLGWSSEHVAYGGSGTPAPSEEMWQIPGESATVWLPADS
jgi:maltooligosyltrehalose trehalohydrolase